MKPHEIEISPIAFDSIRRIRDAKVRQGIVGAIDGLGARPDQGKELAPPLDGLRSIRACRERYRVIYRLDRRVVRVLLVGPRRPGQRTDVYALARSLLDVLLGQRA